MLPGTEPVVSGTGADRETRVLASVRGAVLGPRGAVSEVRAVGSWPREVPVEVVTCPAGGRELARVGALVPGVAGVGRLPAEWEEPVGAVGLAVADVLSV